jgi:hypothetical protein
VSVLHVSNSAFCGYVSSFVISIYVMLRKTLEVCRLCDVCITVCGHSYLCGLYQFRTNAALHGTLYHLYTTDPQNLCDWHQLGMYTVRSASVYILSMLCVKTYEGKARLCRGVLTMVRQYILVLCTQTV